MAPVSGTYGEHLQRMGLPNSNGLVLPYFGYNNNGQLVVRVPGQPDLNLYDVYRRYGAVQLNLPDLVVHQVEKRRLMNELAARRAGYNGIVVNAYATKANDSYGVVRRAVEAGCFQETSSATGVRAAEVLFDEGTLHPEQLVICNGFLIAAYAAKIRQLRDKGFAGIVPVIDKPSVLSYFRTGETWRFGLRQKAHLPAQTPEELDASDTRFGMPFHEAVETAARISQTPGWDVVMFHFHLGSQIEDEDLFLAGLLAGAENYCKLKQQCPSLQYLNIGGGAPYQSTLTPLTIDLERMLENFLRRLKVLCERYRVAYPTVITEWGRFTAAPCELRMMEVATLYDHRIQVKDTIMGSVVDNWAIDHPFPVLSVAGLNQPAVKGRIVGLTCDEDDCLATPDGYSVIARPDPIRAPGSEVLVLANTGAYQSNLGNLEHCALPQEAVVSADLRFGEWVFRVARPRQSEDEVLRLFGWPV